MRNIVAILVLFVSFNVLSQEYFFYDAKSVDSILNKEYSIPTKIEINDTLRFERLDYLTSIKQVRNTEYRPWNHRLSPETKSGYDIQYVFSGVCMIYKPLSEDLYLIFTRVSDNKTIFVHSSEYRKVLRRSMFSLEKEVHGAKQNINKTLVYINMNNEEYKIIDVIIDKIHGITYVCKNDIRIKHISHSGLRWKGGYHSDRIKIID